MNQSEKIKKLYQLKKEVEKSENQILTDQINEVIKKVHYGYRVLSFIGHFSSGKSSLINHLLKEKILPSSPVPTTSNTAQLIFDDYDGIKINLDNHTYSHLEKYEDVKKVNTLNTAIESVEIHKTHDFLKKGSVLQDTPGIDATFKNHEASTMKFLLISDAVFYTVEYNHVNSEKNFEQIRALNRLGVPVILVINQIDKHDDKEISFDEFKLSVTENIVRWGLDVEEMIYTSIYESPYNHISRLKECIEEKERHAEAVKDEYFDRMVNYIENIQKDYLMSVKDQLLTELNAEESNVDELYEQSKMADAVSDEQSLLTREDSEEVLLNEVKRIIKNAYLMPFDQRERNREMLETFAADYKVPGLFGKKEKLKKIQDEKVESVKRELNDRIDKEISFQLMNYFMQFEKYMNETAVSQLKEMTFHMSSDDITSLISNQTSITNDYVLLYSDQLKELTGRKIINGQKQWISTFIKNLNMSKLNTNSQSNDRLVTFDKYYKNEQLIQSLLTENYQHYYIHIDESIDKLIDREETTFALNEEKQESFEMKEKKQVENEQLDEAVNIINAFENVDYFKRDIDRLKESINRIENNTAKIVVFGAFSAGKSAMINALLQEDVLVSSPNPTTASITELRYGKTHYVTFKNEEQILTSLNSMVKDTKQETSSVQSWISKYKTKLNQLEPQERNFAEAVISNFDLYQRYISEGATIEVPSEEIDKYTASDSHAAFVQKISLGIENEFLKDKIIIDSPGTGSTNNRHTKETTEIIADSDLLIYVSYYNHVYTEKDKAFLSYLNEVEVLNNDSRNFFVINAIDLRKDDEELNTVVDYLGRELNTIGITEEIYPLSSREALKEYDEYFSKFKEDINSFVTTGAVAQKIHLVNRNALQIKKTAQLMINDKAEYESRVAARNAYYEELKSSNPFLSQYIEGTVIDTQTYLDQQMRYLKDKMRIQLYDIIKSEINTTVPLNEMQYRYTDAVETKLINELYLMIPRISKYAVSQFNDKHILLKSELAANELMIDTDIDGQYMTSEDLNLEHITDRMNEYKIPVVKEKQLTNSALKTKLYDELHETTLQKVHLIIDEAEKLISSTVINKKVQLNEAHQKNSDLMYHLISEKEAATTDDEMFVSVEKALQQLKG